MQLVLEDIPEAKRIDEVVARLEKLPTGEVLTVAVPDDPRPLAETVLARVGDGYDVAVIHAPHKKKPVRLLHLKRKHRP